MTDALRRFFRPWSTKQLPQAAPAPSVAASEPTQQRLDECQPRVDLDRLIADLVEVADHSEGDFLDGLRAKAAVLSIHLKIHRARVGVVRKRVAMAGQGAWVGIAEAAHTGTQGTHAEDHGHDIG